MHIYTDYHSINESVQREKDAIKAANHKRFEKDRDLIMSQIQERELVKQREREESILQDRRDMEIAKQRALEDEELKQIRKQKQRESQEQLRIENERVKRVQAERAQKEFEYDREQEKIYV